MAAQHTHIYGAAISLAYLCFRVLSKGIREILSMVNKYGNRLFPNNGVSHYLLAYYGIDADAHHMHNSEMHITKRTFSS
jgi:hypothetical protein